MPKSVFSRNYDVLVELLTSARAERGITQALLATRLGKPQSFVAKVEGGERRLDVIEFVAFADALEISAVELFDKLDHRITRPLEI